VNKQNIFLIVLLTGAILALFWLHTPRAYPIVPGIDETPQDCDQSATTTDCRRFRSWKTFDNTRYRYSVSYPSEAFLDAPGNDAASDFGQEPDVRFSLPDSLTFHIFNIEIAHNYSVKGEPGYEDASPERKAFFNDHNKAFSLDVKSYAEFIRTRDVTDVSSTELRINN
jgi:hypothetical protein